MPRTCFCAACLSSVPVSRSLGLSYDVVQDDALCGGVRRARGGKPGSSGAAADRWRAVNTIEGGRLARSTRDIVGNGVVVTDFVESVREYVDKAEVCVVPLLSGSGMRLKILEAMARGKAIVSTPKGAEGIACHNGRDIMVAGSADEFVASVLTLLRDSLRRRELGAAAFRTVKQNYPWYSVGSHFVECYRMAVSTKAGGTAEVACGLSLTL